MEPIYITQIYTGWMMLLRCMLQIHTNSNAEQIRPKRKRVDVFFYILLTAAVTCCLMNRLNVSDLNKICLGFFSHLFFSVSSDFLFIFICRHSKINIHIP